MQCHKLKAPGEIPFQSEDDFKSITKEDMSSATSGESMSEDEDLETLLPTKENSSQSSKELPQ